MHLGYCILAAAEEIQLGNADIMICGGSEAPMNPIGLAGFVASKALSTRNDDPQKASRPWDKDRWFCNGRRSRGINIRRFRACNKKESAYIC